MLISLFLKQLTWLIGTHTSSVLIISLFSNTLPNWFMVYFCICSLLRYDPVERLTAREAMEHSYFSILKKWSRDWSSSLWNKKYFNFVHWNKKFFVFLWSCQMGKNFWIGGNLFFSSLQLFFLHEQRTEK